MKEIIICALLLLISSSSYCQQATPKPTLTQEDYLRKSKYRKTEAFLLLSGGFAILTISAIASDFGCAFCTTEIPVVPMSIGAGMMIGSIPLFKRSKSLKRKAMSLSFKNEKTLHIQNSSLVYSTVPSLSLKFGF